MRPFGKIPGMLGVVFSQSLERKTSLRLWTLGGEIERMVTSGGQDFLCLDMDGGPQSNKFTLKPSSCGCLIIVPPGCLVISERHQLFEL